MGIFMKKIALISCLTAFAILLSSCSLFSSPGTKRPYKPHSPSSSISESSSQLEESLPESSEPVKDYFAIGDSCDLQDWNVTVTDVSFETQIDVSYGHYNADKGNQYVIVGLSIVNNGSREDTIFPYFSLGSALSAKIYYQDEYEYTPDNLISLDEDLHGETIAPLATASGVIVFELPETVINGTDPLILKIYEGSLAYAKYKIK